MPNICMIKDFADKQFEELNRTGNAEGMIGLDYNGTFIINPWWDPTGRFPLSDEEAEDLYGEKAIGEFCCAVEENFTNEGFKLHK